MLLAAMPANVVRDHPVRVAKVIHLRAPHLAVHSESVDPDDWAALAELLNVNVRHIRIHDAVGRESARGVGVQREGLRAVRESEQ